MDDDFVIGSYSSDVVDRVYLLRQLHRRLAGYYRTKVKDPKAIHNLWKRIEAEEYILEQEGFEVK